MGRKSVREDKTIYQQKREALSLSREDASALLETISPERLERLENGRVPFQPRDVLELSRGYRAPELCSHYCANDCPIGAENSRSVTLKELPRIAVETLHALGRVDAIRDALLEVAADGEITSDEYETFARIECTLEQLAASVDSLQLWIRSRKANGGLEDYSAQ